MEYFHSVRGHQNTVHLVKEDTSQSNLHKHQCKTPQQHSESHKETLDMNQLPQYFSLSPTF